MQSKERAVGEYSIYTTNELYKEIKRVVSKELKRNQDKKDNDSQSAPESIRPRLPLTRYTIQVL